jgi:GNAT superfamily N-acetyltransferase
MMAGDITAEQEYPDGVSTAGETEPEPAIYPGPAESPETKPGLFDRRVWRANMEYDWHGLSALRLAAERSLRSRGIQQWTDTARGLDQMAQYTNRDEMYLVREGPTAVGCFVLTDQPDVDFWADDPDRDECLYLHKVIAAPWAKGTGIGQMIVEYSMAEAKARKCQAVRLDCWRGNDKLREHWESLGFTYLRTAEVAGRNSGVLMEQRASGAGGC